MKKRKLNEDLFIDVPEVEYELDTNIDLEGPQPGNDVGVSGLLLDLIGDIAKTINNYNQLQADLKDYPEIAEVIKDFADDENVKLGKVQSALKTISPNAEYIMNGAVEADQELDPGSPLDESLNEADEALDFVTQARFDIFHDGDYDLNKLRDDLESLLQDGLDPIEFLGIDAEGLDAQSSYSYSTVGEVDPDNVSSISFDFGNDGSYDYSFIEDCIEKAVNNQGLSWGEYVDYEDVTYAYPEHNNLSEAHHTSTIKRGIHEGLEDKGLELLNNGIEIESGYGDLYYDRNEDVFYEVKTIPGDKFRNNDLGEALTEQASYGGAFDIEDDMFFTKEDLMEFAYDLKEEFANWCGDKNADISDLYMTSPTHLYIEVMSDGATHSAEIDIDMRKIRTAGDIYKYSDDVLDQWKDSYIEYNPDFEEYKYEV